ncbi:MAG: hypothetical protein HUK26_05225, partial [Duodenibacillus sp.]|nr:hypothetical protein [Duodenibacillus sp.]
LYPEQAEEIKCKNGRIGISPSDRFINIPFWHEARGVDAAVKKDYLLNLIEARVKEVLNHIRCNILEPGYWINRAAAGVVVTGGMANMPGLVEEVGKNLGLKARLGVPRPFPNSAMPLDNPEDTTVAGLFVEAVRMMSRKGKRPFKRGFGGRSVSGALGFFKRLVVGD